MMSRRGMGSTLAVGGPCSLAFHSLAFPFEKLADQAGPAARFPRLPRRPAQAQLSSPPIEPGQQVPIQADVQLRPAA